MTMLTVRNLKPEVHQRLREQAARHGRSMEAEARVILEAGVSDKGADLVSLLREFAEETQLTDAELTTIFPQRHDETQRSVTLGEDT